MSENMASIEDSPESEELVAPTPTPPKRGPGHRGQDVRDTMAEMAAKAHEISLEAGSRMAGTMREVIGAAAGLTAFAIESARDLVQYMVRRGQMSQDEADKLMREVDAAHAALPKPAPKVETAKPELAPKPEPVRAEAPKKAANAPESTIHVEPPFVPRPQKAVTLDAAKPSRVMPPAEVEKAPKLEKGDKAVSAKPAAKGVPPKAPAPAKLPAVKAAPAKAAAKVPAKPAVKAAAKKVATKRR